MCNEHIISEQASESCAEPEPEPARLTPYATQAIELSRALADNTALRFSDWSNGSGEARIALRRRHVAGQMSGKLFERYAAMSIDEKAELEYHTRRAMQDIDSVHDDTSVLVNYVPVFFAGGHMLLPRRDWYDGRDITFASDKIGCPQARHTLVGGLATLLYYLEHPVVE